MAYIPMTPTGGPSTPRVSSIEVTSLKARIAQLEAEVRDLKKQLQQRRAGLKT